MIPAQWKGFTFWISAVLVMILVTIFYQPAAARTGSLLVWTRDHVYVMDIDTLTLERVAPAAPGETVTPSAGCSGQGDGVCRVLVEDRLYQVDLSGGGVTVAEARLPVGEAYRWAGGAVSWSPDGRYLAYTVQNQADGQAGLRIYDALTGEIKITADGVEADVPVAWTAGCSAGLLASGCRVGYKKTTAPEADGLPALVGFSPATEAVQRWTISPEKIFELRWSPDGVLLYSRPKRHFINPEGHAPAYAMPDGARLANLSPDARYAVYYQPFKLADCEAAPSDCLLLGVWLSSVDSDQPALIYNVDLVRQGQGLNFIPIWAPSGKALVFFQEGQLVHYDLTQAEATIWYKGINGKLRSVPIFSPTEEAVAFVDNQGQGYSEYRLVVINPRLQPVEHIIETETGFKVLAWLPE